jgi:hypothetical protein
MPTLLPLIVGILLIGHLAILAASRLRHFGNPGAIEICSNTFRLCDDPLWVGSVGAVLLAVFVWLRRSPSVIAKPRDRPAPDRSTSAEINIRERLHTRPRSVQDAAAMWREDDFDVVDGDRTVGRIYKLDPAKSDWLWGILPEEMPPGRRALGRAHSYEDAKAAFWAAWQSRGRR